MKAGKVENKPVIFRKFSNNEIIALFPEICVDNTGYNCQSYIHVGQHGAASPYLVHTTKLATPTEYKSLYDELVKLGYDMKIIKRFRYKHQEIRREQAKIYSPVVRE